jgi:hypothetical protein
MIARSYVLDVAVLALRSLHGDKDAELRSLADGTMMSSGYKLCQKVRGRRCWQSSRRKVRTETTDLTGRFCLLTTNL